MKFLTAIIAISAVANAAATTTTVEPDSDEPSIRRMRFSTPERRPRTEQAPWAPRGRYDGSVRDRAEYLSQFRNDDEDDFIGGESLFNGIPNTLPPFVNTTTTAQPTSSSSMEAPWAPRRGFSGLARDRPAYLATLRRD